MYIILYRAALVSPNTAYLNSILCIECTTILPGGPRYGNRLKMNKEVKRREVEKREGERMQREGAEMMK